jgi:hypothetical protein
MDAMDQCAKHGNSTKKWGITRCQMRGRMEAPKVGDGSENVSSSGIRIAAKDAERPKASCTSITSCQSVWAGQT